MEPELVGSGSARDDCSAAPQAEGYCAPVAQDDSSGDVAAQAGCSADRPVIRRSCGRPIHLLTVIRLIHLGTIIRLCRRRTIRFRAIVRLCRRWLIRLWRRAIVWL